MVLNVFFFDLSKNIFDALTNIFVLCCCQPTVFHSLDSSISITAASGGSSGTTSYNEKSCYNILRLQVFKISFNVSTDLITSSFGGSVAAGATFAFFFAAFFFFFAGFFFGDGFGCRINGFYQSLDDYDILVTYSYRS